MDTITQINSIIAKANELKEKIINNSNRAVKLQGFNSRQLIEIGDNLDGLIDLMKSGMRD